MVSGCSVGLAFAQDRGLGYGWGYAGYAGGDGLVYSRCAAQSHSWANRALRQGHAVRE